MKPLIDSPPRTMMEVFKQLPEGTLAELIDNQLYMSPSPSFNHQDVLIEIATRIRTELKKRNAKVIVAPFDIYLDDERNAVQPDITVIFSDNKGKLNQNGHFHGVPDIVFEILSPGNKDHDLIRKKSLYEQFGVKEYWIVDPDTRLAIGYRLEEKSYVRIAEDIGVIKSPLIAATVTF